MRYYIDLSQYNNVVSSNLNADGVILRLGYTGYSSNEPTLDKSFIRKYSMYSGKYPVGIYYVTIATTDEEVEKEVAFVLEHIKGLQLELPIWVDVEEQKNSRKWSRLGKTERTRLVKKWCQLIEDAGYYVGIYASLYWFNSKLIDVELEEFDKWVAQYNHTCKYKGKYGLWQFTSKEDGGKHGVQGKVDMSISFYDYPSIIKKNGLNKGGVV